MERIWSSLYNGSSHPDTCNGGIVFTVIDSIMYGIIGDTDAARAKLYEMPMAFVGLGLGYKGAKLASTAFKIEEKAIATEAKTFNFDLQLFAKGSSKPTSKTFGQPIETTIGGTKVKLRVDAEPDGNKIQIQAGHEKVQ